MYLFICTRWAKKLHKLQMTTSMLLFRTKKRISPKCPYRVSENNDLVAVWYYLERLHRYGDWNLCNILDHRHPSHLHGDLAAARTSCYRWPESGDEYVHLYVRLCLRVSVSPGTYLRNYTPSLHQIITPPSVGERSIVMSVSVCLWFRSVRTVRRNRAIKPTNLVVATHSEKNDFSSFRFFCGFFIAPGQGITVS